MRHPPSQHPVYITGIGFAGAAGSGVKALSERLSHGVSAIGMLEPEEQTLLKYAAILPSDWNWRETDGIQSLNPESLSQAERLLKNQDASIQAAAAALLEAKGSTQIDPKRLGLVVGGSNLFHTALFEQMARFNRNPAYVNPRIGYQALDSHVAATLAALIDARGPVMNVATAAASGATAALTALDWIRLGRCDACFAIGAMQRLSPIDCQALASMGALSTASSPSYPFDSEATGFVPGEAAACILLESADHAHSSGAKPLAELAGGALISSCDPLPHPCKEDETRVMQLALQDAGIKPQQIDLIIAHATGTLKGDAAEASAIGDLFDAQKVLISAPKAVTGHCLTAAGMIGLISGTLMLNEGHVYPQPKPFKPISNDLRFATEVMIDRAMHYAINNAFGFGGFNASLVIKSFNR